MGNAASRSTRAPNAGVASAPKGLAGQTSVASDVDFAITALTPDSAKAGEEIKITGLGFFQTDAMRVRFNNKIEKMRRVDGRTLVATVPDLLAPGPVEIAITFDGAHWQKFNGTFVFKLDLGALKAEMEDYDVIHGRITAAGKAASPQDIERESIILGHPLKFYQHFFGHIPDLIREYAEAMVPEAGVWDIDEYKDALMMLFKADDKIKVKLILSDLAFAPVFPDTARPPTIAAWAAGVKASSSRGLVRAALQVGPWILEWNDELRLCRPRISIYQDVLIQRATLGEERTLTLPRDVDVLRAMCKICTDWNSTEHKGNNQHFIDELLGTIPEWKHPSPGSSLDSFLESMRKRNGRKEAWSITNPKTGEVSEFNTHSDLDNYCTQREARVASDDTRANPLGAWEDQALLKAIDGAMWLRHVCDENAEAYQPCTQTDECYFNDPRRSYPFSRFREAIAPSPASSSGS